MEWHCTVTSSRDPYKIRLRKARKLSVKDVPWLGSTCSFPFDDAKAAPTPSPCGAPSAHRMMGAYKPTRVVAPHPIQMELDKLNRHIRGALYSSG